MNYFKLRILGMKFSFTVLFLLFLGNAEIYSMCRNIREANLKNEIYPLKSDDLTKGKMKWLRMSNGFYEDRSIPTNLAYLYMKIVDIAFGDLTGDKKEEAAVSTIYGSNSASFFLTDTYIFGCVAGKVKLIGILKQDRIEKDGGMDLQESVRNPLKIKGGILYITHGTEGNRPSPEFTTTFCYKIVNNKLAPYKYPLIGFIHSR